MKAVLVVLSCLHTVSFINAYAPRAGELVLCMKCGTYQEAVQTPHDYVVKCLSCHRLHDKTYGNAYLTAETAAVKHSLRYTGHEVQLWDGGVLHATYHHLVLAVTDVPPF
jgi:hypothetical protein